MYAYIFVCMHTSIFLYAFIHIMHASFIVYMDARPFLYVCMHVKGHIHAYTVCMQIYSVLMQSNLYNQICLCMYTLQYFISVYAYIYSSYADMFISVCMYLHEYMHVLPQIHASCIQFFHAFRYLKCCRYLIFSFQTLLMWICSLDHVILKGLKRGQGLIRELQSIGYQHTLHF